MPCGRRASADRSLGNGGENHRSVPWSSRIRARWTTKWSTCISNIVSSGGCWAVSSAQGFVYHDLSRACLAQASDAIPRVVLLGRLCLYGPGAARLHEELIEIAARWTDPKLRKGPIAPYGREAESKTLHLLEEALLPKSGHAITETVQKQLQACAPRDVQELLPHLQSRGEEYAADALKKLRERAEAEAKAMQVILETQKSTSPRRPPSMNRVILGHATCRGSPRPKTSGGSLKPTSGTGSSGWPRSTKNSRRNRIASVKCTR